MILSELTCDATVEVTGGHLMNSRGSVWDIVENLIILHACVCVCVCVCVCKRERKETNSSKCGQYR